MPEASAHVTPHFLWSETWTTDQRDYAIKNRQLSEAAAPTITATCRLMEGVRTVCGDLPISVHSMFRCWPLNTHIGGSTSSQHPKGEACDFHVVGLSLRSAFDKIRASELKWGQLLLEGHTGGDDFSWIHISLGAPWRDPTKCQQVGEVRGNTYHWL